VLHTDCVPLPPVLAAHEQLYLRSVAPAGKKSVASHLPALFPELAAALAPPPQPGNARYHSSVLRAASAGSALWMHYDTHDNLLSQARLSPVLCSVLCSFCAGSAMVC